MTDTQTIERQAELLGVVAGLECRVHNLENKLAAQCFWGNVFNEQNRTLQGDVEYLRAQNIVLQHTIDDVQHVDMVVS